MQTIITIIIDPLKKNKSLLFIGENSSSNILILNIKYSHKDTTRIVIIIAFIQKTKRYFLIKSLELLLLIFNPVILEIPNRNPKIKLNIAIPQILEEIINFMIDFLLMSENIEPKDEIPPNTTNAIAVKIPTKVIN